MSICLRSLILPHPLSHLSCPYRFRLKRLSLSKRPQRLILKTTIQNLNLHRKLPRAGENSRRPRHFTVFRYSMHQTQFGDTEEEPGSASL
jgi:hypothetical protein